MKLLSLLLVFAMLLSFAACNTTPVEPADSTADSTAPEETTTADTMDIQTGAAYYNAADYLPAETFDGETITVWMEGAHLYGGIPEDRMIEGDVVQSAVMDRNAAVENALDVKFEWNLQFDKVWRDQAALRQSILGGDEYDIVEGVAVYMMPQLVYGNYFDLAENPYIDLSQPWWHDAVNSNMDILGRQYLASGYLSMRTLDRMHVIYFNSPLAMDLRLGNLYDLVNNGEWTIDKMQEMAEMAASDLNQDGIMDSEDRFGLSGRWDQWAGEGSTAGYSFVDRSTDEYKVVGVTDTLYEIHDEIYPMITSANYYYSYYTYGVHPKYSGAEFNIALDMFTNNRILFLQETLGTTANTKMRHFGAYGLLPSPKYVEGQEEYGSHTSPFAAALCVTTGDAKISSIVLEALQIESYNIVRPAYVHTALSYKYLSDPQSVDMLNYIFTRVTTDWIYNMGSVGFAGGIQHCIAREPMLASFMQTKIGAVQQGLDDFLASIEEMPENNPFE